MRKYLDKFLLRLRLTIEYKSNFLNLSDSQIANKLFRIKYKEMKHVKEISNANLEIQKSLQDKEDDRDFKNPYGEVESPHPDWWNNNNG